MFFFLSEYFKFVHDFYSKSARGVIERRLQTRENKEFQHRRRQRQQERRKRNSFNCWLHTRLLKYNPSVLGTFFECEGVKCTYFNFTSWPWKRLSSKKRKFVAKCGLHHTWPIRKGSHVQDVHAQRFQDSNERTDAHACLGLRRALRKRAKTRTYVDFFCQKSVVQSF